MYRTPLYQQVSKKKFKKFYVDKYVDQKNKLIPRSCSNNSLHILHDSFNVPKEVNIYSSPKNPEKSGNKSSRGASRKVSKMESVPHNCKNMESIKY